MAPSGVWGLGGRVAAKSKHGRLKSCMAMSHDAEKKINPLEET